MINLVLLTAGRERVIDSF